MSGREEVPPLRNMGGARDGLVLLTVAFLLSSFVIGPAIAGGETR